MMASRVTLLLLLGRLTAFYRLRDASRWSLSSTLSSTFVVNKVTRNRNCRFLRSARRHFVCRGRRDVDSRLQLITVYRRTQYTSSLVPYFRSSCVLGLGLRWRDLRETWCAEEYGHNCEHPSRVPMLAGRRRCCVDFPISGPSSLSGGSSAT